MLGILISIGIIVLIIIISIKVKNKRVLDQAIEELIKSNSYRSVLVIKEMLEKKGCVFDEKPYFSNNAYHSNQGYAVFSTKQPYYLDIHVTIYKFAHEEKMKWMLRRCPYGYTGCIVELESIILNSSEVTKYSDEQIKDIYENYFKPVVPGFAGEAGINVYINGKLIGEPSPLLPVYTEGN